MDRAGGAAGNKHRKMAERARVLREEAERLEKQAGAWAAGEVGERRVGAVLDRIAAEFRALVLHDRLTRAGSKANIDHVVVTPGGVFIVDTKNWYGYVNATPDALIKDNVDQWRALEYGKDAAKLAKDVAGWLPVFPFVCLAGAARIMEPRRSAGVTVLNVEDLGAFILGKPAKATPNSARDTYASLTMLFPAQPASPRQDRRAAAQGKHGVPASGPTRGPDEGSRTQGQFPKPPKPIRTGAPVAQDHDRTPLRWEPPHRLAQIPGESPQPRGRTHRQPQAPVRALI